MKKLMAILLCCVFMSGISPAVLAEEEVLRVYNWQDYIDDGKDENGETITKSVIELWEEDFYRRTGRKVRVQYDMFETNETMLNTFKTGKTSYDLACPSDYVIQKMIAATKNNSDESIALEKFDLSKMENYQKYVSPYIANMFEEHGWTEYAVGYMWGTVGMLYNPENIAFEDVNTWNIFWNPSYKNRITCKDVSRDAYVIGALKVYSDDLMEKIGKFNKGSISADELQKFVNSVANNTSDDTISKVKEALAEMKKNIYGFEVDTGKTDIVAGKIDANLAWSGDAVYAMDLAEEEDDKKLQFVIPKEGSTVWFDGWIMPKGANTELAQDFVDFLCRPEIAARNMNYIGYTSVIAGDEIYDMVIDNYGDEEGTFERDLTYFFKRTLSDDKYTSDGRVVIKTSEENRQLYAQYPSKEETARLGIMEDFGDRNEKVLEMWSSVKSNEMSSVVYILMAVIIIVAIAFLILSARKRQKKNRRRKKR